MNMQQQYVKSNKCIKYFICTVKKIALVGRLGLKSEKSWSSWTQIRNVTGELTWLRVVVWFVIQAAVVSGSSCLSLYWIKPGSLWLTWNPVCTPKFTVDVHTWSRWELILYVHVLRRNIAMAICVKNWKLLRTYVEYVGMIQAMSAIWIIYRSRCWILRPVFVSMFSLNYFQMA